MPLRNHSNGSNTLYVFNMDVGSSLNRIAVGQYNGARWLPCAYGQLINVLKHFVFSNMDVGSILNRMAASIMM